MTIFTYFLKLFFIAATVVQNCDFVIPESTIRYTGLYGTKIGLKRYEFTNHLGNVLTTLSDRRIGVDPNNDLLIDHYIAVILSSSDYYAGGSQMPGRGYAGNNDYRYGAGGQEKVDELGSGHYTAMYWEYDSRLMRRWNLDPIEMPWESRYVVFHNNPILYNDPDGDCATCRPTKAGTSEGEQKTVGTTRSTQTYYYHGGGTTEGGEVTKSGWYKHDEYKAVFEKHISFYHNDNNKEIVPYISGTLQMANISLSKAVNAAFTGRMSSLLGGNEIFHMPNQDGKMTMVPNPSPRGLETPVIDPIEVAATFGTSILLKAGATYAPKLILYRVLRAEEDVAIGLIAKNPSAAYSVAGHVRMGSRLKTQFISTTTDIDVARAWAQKTGNRIVKIDASMVQGEIIDLTDEVVRVSLLKSPITRNFATKSKEMLIKGTVPADALKIVK